MQTTRCTSFSKVPQKSPAPLQKVSLEKDSEEHWEASDSFQPSTSKSAPAAPPETSTFPLSLTDLPQDALQKIVASLQSEQPFLDYLNLSSLKLVNKTFRKIIDPPPAKSTDPSPQESSRENDSGHILSAEELSEQLHQIVNIANIRNGIPYNFEPETPPTQPVQNPAEYYKNLKERIKKESAWSTPPFIRQVFSGLGTHPQEQRQPLIELAKSLKNQQVKECLCSHLAQHLELFNSAQQNELLHNIANDAESPVKTFILHHFIKECQKLDSQGKNALLEASSQLSDDSLKHFVFQSFMEKLDLLNDSQKNRFFNAVMEMNNSMFKHSILLSLAPKQRFFSQAQQTQLKRDLASIRPDNNNSPNNQSEPSPINDSDCIV